MNHDPFTPAERERKLRVESALQSSFGKGVSHDPIGACNPSGDLAAALWELSCSGEHVRFIGELALNGTVRPVRELTDYIDTLPEQVTIVVVPASQAPEAREFFAPRRVVGVETLREAYDWCQSGHCFVIEPWKSTWTPGLPDLDPLRKPQRDALHAAAEHVRAGRNVYLEGAPGCGKTMIARRIPLMLPPITHREALETSRIHSRAGILMGGILRARPFRAPHHTVRRCGLEQEVRLARHGILTLDEAPKFNALNELDTEGTSVVLAGNPCPCGYFSSRRGCRCTEYQIQRHRDRVSNIIREFNAVRIEVTT